MHILCAAHGHQGQKSSDSWKFSDDGVHRIGWMKQGHVTAVIRLERKASGGEIP